MSSYFKEKSAEKPGMQFEFHIRGHHSKKRKAGKDKGKPEAERTSVWYERYIVLTLPSDDVTFLFCFKALAPNFRRKCRKFCFSIFLSTMSL